MRRGWYFGSQEFREKLLDRLGRDGLEADRKTRKRYTRADLKDHDLELARQILAAGMECTGLAETDLTSRGGQPEERFTEYRVIAPCGGTVIRWHLHNGERVDEKTETIEISDLTKVWVDLSVNESRIDAIRTGQPVEVLFSGATPKARATVGYIDPIVDTKTRTATVRVVLDNPAGRYKPGRFVTGRIRVREDDQVVSVPADSVQLSGDQPCVFVRCEKGFELRHVTVGVSTRKEVEIREGLQAGDEVVVRGAFHLKAELARQAAGGVQGHGHAH